MTSRFKKSNWNLLSIKMKSRWLEIVFVVCACVSVSIVNSVSFSSYFLRRTAETYDLSISINFRTSSLSVPFFLWFFSVFKSFYVGIFFIDCVLRLVFFLFLLLTSEKKRAKKNRHPFTWKYLALVLLTVFKFTWVEQEVEQKTKNKNIHSHKNHRQKHQSKRSTHGPKIRANRKHCQTHTQSHTLPRFNAA